MISSTAICGRLCIIVAVVILLFLPLTFSVNNNNALAQTPHCEFTTYPNPQTFDPYWCLYERNVESYFACIEGFTRHNEMYADFGLFIPVDISTMCPAPTPPEPLQTMDCNELQTCSGNQPIDWNEEAREDCQLERQIFFTVFCAGVDIVSGKNPLPGAACQIAEYEAGELCNIEFPPDIRRYGKPGTEFNPTDFWRVSPFDYCDLPRSGCLRGW